MMTTSRGVYIHIPFCGSKCRYCDFLSFENTDSLDRYIPRLMEEIRGAAADTVFIGGGTPSLLAPGYIEELLFALDIDEGAEVSIEANPESLTREKARAYRDMGINRISMGFQSLDEDMLSLLGRIHGRGDCFRAYDAARDAGFENINVDVMFALPGQSAESLYRTLEEILDLEPEHISAYSLQLEPGTVLSDMVERGLLRETDEEADRNMYHGIIDILSGKGYAQYEVSNFSLPGRQCRHNLKYWSMEEYIGAGLGASSFYEGRRIANTRDMEKYLRGDRVESIHVNSLRDNAGEYVFTGMRKTEGITYEGFRSYAGCELKEYYPWFAEKSELWEKQGLIIRDDKGFRFTLKGTDIQNSVLKEFV